MAILNADDRRDLSRAAYRPGERRRLVFQVRSDLPTLPAGASVTSGEQ